MKIVIISEWFSELMGYSDNCLPKALAAHGHEVHLVTSDLKPYATAPFYGEVYEPFIGPPVVAPGRSMIDGVTVHRLRHIDLRGRLGLRGLSRLLREVRPDVVQVMSHASLAAVQAAALQPLLRYRLFTANHVLRSVFPPPGSGWPDNRWWTLRTNVTLGAVGRAVSSRTVRCYAATDDAAEIASTFFGVPPEKVAVRTLGVDTEVFHPVRSPEDEEERRGTRLEMGFEDDDVVCVYSGRFAPGKDPACLAAAIGGLAGSTPRVRGLFIGNGPQEGAIRATEGCVTVPFVAFPELGRWFRAADVGAWPRQESMSVLDAGACGLPVVMSNRVSASDRLAGALTYEEGDAASLAATLRSLADPGLRHRMGQEGAARSGARSWMAVAADRLADFDAAVAGHALPPA